MNTSGFEDEIVSDLRDTVRAVCDNKFGGPARLRRQIEAGTPWFDDEAWAVLAGELGLSALGLPENAGGLGGIAELLAVAEELGRALISVPFLTSTVLAGQALARCGIRAAEALERVAAGGQAALVAPQLHGGSPRDVSLEDGLLSGAWPFVPGAPGAELLVVATDEVLCLVETAQPGVTVRPLPTLDLASTAGSVTLKSARVVVLGPTSALDGVFATAAAVVAADQLGGAQACLDLTVEYAKQRVQFSRQIGSFQAVKHTIADMMVKVELARSGVLACAEANSARQLAEASLVARIWCNAAYRFVSAECVQLHGGIGFTWEHEAHLYFRRARADALLLGSTSACRRQLADLKGW